MTGSSNFPESIHTILVTRLDGLGDIVLGTMLLHGLHAKWPNAKIRLIVRPQMSGVARILPAWVEVQPLPFDPRITVVGREAEIVEQLGRFAAGVHADLAIVAEYNRTWAGEILAAICGAKSIIAFDGKTGLNLHHRDICKALNAGSFEKWQTVHVECEEREPGKYAKLLDALGIEVAGFLPAIVLRDEDRHAAGQLWAETGAEPSKSVVCFPGSGEGLARSLDPSRWARLIAHIQSSRPLVLLGSEADRTVLEEIISCGLAPGTVHVVLPTEDTGIMAAFIERGGAYVGMDTGPMHVAAVLGRPTLGIFGGGHRAHRFLPVGRFAAAVRMPIGCYGCEWHCPFDQRLCIKDIPELPLYDAGDAFLRNVMENIDPFSPRIFELSPPAELPTAVLGPMMRQHRLFLTHNHDIIEHHVYIAERFAAIADILARLTQENHDHREQVGIYSTNLAEMTRQNEARDQAIARINQALYDMTLRNDSRDQAIAHVNDILAEMTLQNQARDQAIAHINSIIAEMTVHNELRDQAIALASQRVQ